MGASASRNPRVDPKRLRALHAAIAAGNTRRVRSLVASTTGRKRSALVNATDEFGRTALLVAAEYSDEAVAVYLLDHGARVNDSDVDGQTALHKTVINDDVVIGRQLCGRLGCNVNVQDRAGDTPLMLAACHERVDFAQLLLEHGADVDLPNVDMVTPLMRAARNNGAMALWLLQHGANPFARALNGQTALRNAHKGSELAARLQALLPTPPTEGVVDPPPAVEATVENEEKVEEGEEEAPPRATVAPPPLPLTVPATPHRRLRTPSTGSGSPLEKTKSSPGLDPADVWYSRDSYAAVRSFSWVEEPVAAAEPGPAHLGAPAVLSPLHKALLSVSIPSPDVSDFGKSPRNSPTRSNRSSPMVTPRTPRLH